MVLALSKGLEPPKNLYKNILKCFSPSTIKPSSDICYGGGGHLRHGSHVGKYNKLG